MLILTYKELRCLKIFVYLIVSQEMVREPPRHVFELGSEKQWSWDLTPIPPLNYVILPSFLIVPATSSHHKFPPQIPTKDPL